MTTNFFHPFLLFLFLDPLSGSRDPGSEMGKKSGSGINIPDPQHCLLGNTSVADPDPGSKAFLTPGSGKEKKFGPGIQDRQ
jgi:hypothetical protein